jgi:hypothetical protein
MRDGRLRAHRAGDDEHHVRAGYDRHAQACRLPDDPSRRPMIHRGILPAGSREASWPPRRPTRRLLGATTACESRQHRARLDVPDGIVAQHRRVHTHAALEDSPMIRTRLLVGAVVVAALLPMAPASAMAADPPITLRLATSEDPDRPSQPFLDRFAAEVEGRSGGSMTVEIIYAAGGHESDKEMITAQRVQDGDVELAVIPTRAWGDIGVTSVQALMAPFLIDNDGLLRAVGTDEAVLQPMMEGMAEHGLIGLAIWPESLRHLFTFEENGPPITDPSDLVGQTMFVVGSTLQNQIIEALGATTSNVFPPDELVHDGTLRGAEYSLAFYNLYYPPATVTADVIFYPKAFH